MNEQMQPTPKVVDLPLWEDFPFTSDIPAGYELRHGRIAHAAFPADAFGDGKSEVWSIVHKATGLHLDGALAEHDMERGPAFWVRLFVMMQQAVMYKLQGSSKHDPGHC